MIITVFNISELMESAHIYSIYYNFYSFHKSLLLSINSYCTCVLIVFRTKPSYVWNGQIFNWIAQIFFSLFHLTSTVTSKYIRYCMKHLMTYRGGVITVILEMVVNHVPPVLSSLEFARLHSKYIILRTKNYCEYRWEMFSLQSADCVLHDCVNTIFLGWILPELLCNKFFRVLFIIVCRSVKERGSISNKDLTAYKRSCFFSYRR